MPQSLDLSRLRDHLTQRLLPLWDRFGWDATHGGFHSRLDPRLQPVPDGFKRLTVQMRQLYVYSLAALASPDDPIAGPRADATFRHALARFWDSEHGGWFFTTTPQGKPLDRTKDTYSHAFAILGLTHYHHLRPEAGALELAIRTLDLMDRYLRDSRYGGFLEATSNTWAPQSRVRRHDPHMHLFEAALAACELGYTTRFEALAQELLDLMLERLYPPPYVGLAETYDQDWTPAAGTHSEPGHHFEWFWLLERARRMRLRELPEALLRALFQFGESHGVDPADGAVFDRVELDGRPRDTNKRVWPQTEYQKALAILLDSDHAWAPASQTEQRLGRSLDLCFERYIDASHGGWNEHADRAGRIHSDAMNATTVYHVYVAFREVAHRLGDVRDRSKAGGESSR